MLSSFGEFLWTQGCYVQLSRLFNDQYKWKLNSSLFSILGQVARMVLFPIRMRYIFF